MHEIKPVTECKTLRELFADPARWIKQASARDVSGSITDSDGPEAVSWCAWGAIDHFFPHRGEDDTNPLRIATAKRLRDAACRLGIARVHRCNVVEKESDVSLAGTNDAIDYPTLLRWLEAAEV